MWANSQPVTSTTDMSAWFLTLHNDVNRRINDKTKPKTPKSGWTCETLVATYTGKLDTGRTVLDELKGVIGDAAWTTLDTILVSAMTPPSPE